MELVQISALAENSSRGGGQTMVTMSTEMEKQVTSAASHSGRLSFDAVIAILSGSGSTHNLHFRFVVFDP
eukprot:SAG31_NODE_6018_length_2209_cov_1.239810_2_plen_70_part_00